MNRKKVNGSTMVKTSLLKKRNDVDSNSTDSFDMNDFKTSSLTKKYNVPIHKNNADLMAELDNIMGDESDCEIIEPKIEKNGLKSNASISTAHSSDGRPNDDFENDKQERILSWAQSQSQNLSMRVASVLSDHDYLSQELLLGIVAGNEEHTEQENQRKLNESAAIESENKSQEHSGETDTTICQTKDNVTTDNEILPKMDINDFNSIIKKLTESTARVQSLSLLNEIEEKAKQMKAQFNTKCTENVVNNSVQMETQDNEPEFSPNHSEPLEYNGYKISTQNSSDEIKDKNDELITQTKSDLSIIDDIANRITIDATSIRSKLGDTEGQSQDHTKTIEKLRENLGLLMEDMAKELHKTAMKLNPKIMHKETELQLPTTLHKKMKTSQSDLSVDENNEFRRKKLKKRRKRQKSEPNNSNTTSSSSDDSVDKRSKRSENTDEPFVISQNIDELLNGNANSNSANGSIRKENDFLGFDDIDIDIKSEGMLDESITLNLPASQKESIQSTAETDNDLLAKEKSLLDSVESTQIISPTINDNSSKVSVEKEQSNGAVKDVDIDDSASMSSFHNIDSDDDDDDDDIRKLCDLTSLTSKRIASIQAATKVNGIVEPKKPPKKTSKEDEVSKFLANVSTERDKTAESEEERSEHEEYTEDHFLAEQNMMLKEQLLQDSSDSDANSDSDQLNGKGSDFSADSEDSNQSNESFFEKFLASESMSSDERKGKEIKFPADPVGQSELNTKEISLKRKTDKDIQLDDDEELDSDIELDGSDLSSPKSIETPRKSKSTVGKNIFSNIEKDKHILIHSDDEDMSGNESKIRSNNEKPEADLSEKDEIIDTTMFKTTKKDFTPNQLSRIIQANRNKPTTSRLTPECISVSSDDDFEIDTTTSKKKDVNEDDDEEKDKRGKRKLLRHDQLADDTKQAQREESDRIKRLDKKNVRLSQFIESQRFSQSDSESLVDPNEVLLDVDTKMDKKILVHPEITKHLKKHQVEGIKFMYDCCYGGVDNLEKFPGSGCILAHCMGLGKTLQLITLLHTVICFPQLKTDKVLVICPKSTVMNWKEEIERWLGSIKNTRKIKLFHFPEQSDINTKLLTLKEWSQCGKDGNKQAGCLLLGYEAFRVLVFYHNTKKSIATYTSDELEKLRKNIHKYLLDPGADLVVCDEGHMIKNQKSTTSMAVNKILTKRRIVLTGTPIQNNLKEYYSMVNFIKPSFLGTEKEFANLYVNPIKNGQHKDSSKSEIKYMKQRSYVLHKKLSKFVQRREAALLKSFLPQKYEFVLFIPMTTIQEELYEYFLKNRPNQDQKGKSLIPDYTVLRKIWTHPKVLENAYINAIQNKTKVKLTTVAAPPPANDSDEDQPDDVFDSQTGEMSVKNDWWRTHLKKEDLETILPSNKLIILFEILKQCERNKEKCLIFSAFVAVLDVVEYFMRLINDQERNGNKPGLETFRGRWELGKDYYRLDGKTAKNHRHSMITNFNDPKNERTRVFLISAKAGGQGINLIGANRVILLDTSWNPSNDQQNIFRVFRLGQKRVCYIYRLISMGTMEEKVYSRSVTKQAMSCRVMDEQQIDRHYNMAELTELYILTKSTMEERPTPNVPKDDLLAHLLINFPQKVYKYHEHDSLLENKGEEELSEQEKNDAWAAYEADVKRKNESNFGPYNNTFGMYQNYSGLGSYANSLFGNYNNLSGVSGLNYPYNMYAGQYNPYGGDYSQMRFDNYSAFYNNLMNIAGTSMSNYNPNSSNMLSPNNSSSSVTSPQPNMNFPSPRNWMQSNASSSNYANNLLTSLTQSPSSSKSSYSSYLNSLYNALGTNNVTSSSTTKANPSTSKTPPLALTAATFDPMAYLQNQHMPNIGPANSNSTTPLPSSSSTQQGPNALRNPLLTKELSIPRNPTMANSKEMFSVPIPTSVITKSTTGSPSPLTALSPGSSNQSDASKSTNKSPDDNITSTGPKTTKNATEPQITVRNIRTLNNGSRDSPDTTGNNQPENKSTDKASASNTVSSSVIPNDSAKKGNNKSATTAVSSNMGIVYPPPKPTQVASTSKAALNSTILVSTTTKPSGVVINKVTQPMPTIIRKPAQANSAKSTDPTNDAVAAINKNKALTVTARSINAPTAKPKVTGVNNSITLSPILNSTNKTAGNSMSITPQPTVQGKTTTQGRPMNVLTKTNTATVPVAITKVIPNQLPTKSTSPVTKPNVLSSRNSNTAKAMVSIPKSSIPSSSAPTNARVLNSNQSVQQRIVGRTQGLTPIIARTKTRGMVQLQTTPVNNKPVNNTNLQINRVQSLKTRQTSPIVQPKIVVNRANTTITPITSNKRPATESINLDPAKKPKTAVNSMATSSVASGSKKSSNPLTGIRLTRTTSSQSTNSQVSAPVEIVELE